MTSKVQICNMALSRIGAATITALTDNTAEAKLCSTLFDDLADRVMMQGSWTSTITRASLVQTSTTPTFEFTYEYQLPTDPKCLKVLGIDEDTIGRTEYKIEGDKLLTDSSSIKIRYIGQLTDTEDYDPLLVEAIEVLLASYLAKSITGSTVDADRLRQEYFELVDRNLALDGQQGSKDSLISDDFTIVR